MTLETLQSALGVTFNSEQLLKNAFIHSSFCNESNKESLESNERLEFLGDAVLELVITEFLYKSYANPEGELTNIRSALVNGENLSSVARSLELGKLLKLSKGEENSGGREKDYILANTMEAVIGAAYMDGGYESAKQLIHKHITPSLDDIIQEARHIDAKSAFQEIAQEKEGFTPTYRMIDEKGPDHEKIFTMGCYIEETEISRAEGPSKQQAEQNAARKALDVKGWSKNLMKLIPKD